jgi:hypothetical protein
MTKATKLPFEVIIYDTEPVQVTNPFSGESVTLTPEEVAVYDTITGANMIGDYKTVRKGLDWFRKVNPSAYMVLLD